MGVAVLSPAYNAAGAFVLRPLRERYLLLHRRFRGRSVGDVGGRTRSGAAGRGRSGSGRTFGGGAGGGGGALGPGAAGRVGETGPSFAGLQGTRRIPFVRTILPLEHHLVTASAMFARQFRLAGTTASRPTARRTGSRPATFRRQPDQFPFHFRRFLDGRCFFVFHTANERGVLEIRVFRWQGLKEIA